MIFSTLLWDFRVFSFYSPFEDKKIRQQKSAGYCCIVNSGLRLPTTPIYTKAHAKT